MRTQTIVSLNLAVTYFFTNLPSFSADNQSLTAILNRSFPKALVPFTAGMVNMQYTEIRAGKQCSAESDSVWDAVWIESDFNTACQNFRLVLERIEEAASKVGAPLSRRVEEDQRNLIQANSRKEAPKGRLPRRVIEKLNTKKRLVRPSQSSASPDQRIEHWSTIPIASQPETQRQSTVQVVIPAVEIQTTEQNGKFLVPPPRSKY